jgi:two-component system, cell cycle response regulator
MQGRPTRETTIEESSDYQPTILVVDDEAPVRHFLKVLLERLGYRVDTATGGPDALRKTAKVNYDVVLTDLIMPRMDGLEVIRRVKEISPETEVVMITGYPSSETIVAATRAGALDYLPKSPDPEHLAVLVEKAMKVRALRRKAAERDFYVRMAQMDGLTELFTRTSFRRSLEAEFNRAQRAPSPLSLLFVGVDALTEMQRERGTLFGDRVLRSIAEVMKGSCRNYDILARYSEDSFAVIAPSTDPVGNKILGDRINERTATVLLDDDATPPTVSVGGVSFPADADSPDALIEEGESALRNARRTGPGSVHIT